MQANARDIAAGALFIAIGLFFAIDSMLNLRIGQAFAMGPGYFPLVMALVLVGFGVAIALQALGRSTEAFGRVSWRGVGLIAGSILFFALTVRGLGMALALLGSVWMASMSTGLINWRGSILLAVILTAFNVVVFIYLLGLPYPVIGNWLWLR